MHEGTRDGLFNSFAHDTFLLLLVALSSVVAGNLFLAGLWWALGLPRRIEGVRMRQDHATRPGEQREVEIGIEPTGCAIPLKFLKIVRDIWVMLPTHPDQQIVDGQSLPIERRFTRWKHTLPGLRLIHQIKPFRDWQRRIDEELLQWPSPGRQGTLGIDTTRFAISTAARDGISFGKIQVKHRFVLLFIMLGVEQ